MRNKFFYVELKKVVHGLFLISMCVSCIPLVDISIAVKPMLNSLSLIQEQGSVSATNKLVIKGNGLQYLSSVDVSGYSCNITIKASNEVSCEIQASLAPNYYDVKLTDSSKRVSVIPKAYAAGAVVIGQPTFQSLANVESYALGTAGGIFVHSSGALYVGDNVKALKWNAIPAADAVSANSVFGVPGFGALTGAQLYANHLEEYPEAMLSGAGFCQTGSQFIILDSVNHRAKIFEGEPSAWDQKPKYVLGQTSSGGQSANQGGTTSASSLSDPRGIWCNDNYIVIADAGNHRVLIWNKAIVSNAQEADVVLGQPDFTSGLANQGTPTIPSASTLYSPSAVYSDGTRLFIADTSNNRIIIHNSLALVSTHALAGKVLGQTQMDTRNSATSQARFSTPYGVTGNSSYLYISDYNNHRVLVWSLATSIDTWADGRNPDFVLGQADFTSKNSSNSLTRSLQNMNGPKALHASGTHLFLADTLNSRILVWNQLPLITNEIADFQIGQKDGSRRDMAPQSSASNTVRNARGAFKTNDNKVFVLDYNSRVLRYSSFEQNYPSADLIIGHSDFESSECITPKTGATLCNVFGFNYDKNRDQLLVPDTGNNRVLIWNSLPTSNNQVADVVVGQPDFLTSSLGTTANKLAGPRGVCQTSNYLFVSSGGGHSVLRYTLPLSTTNHSASLILGQPDFTTASSNQGGLSNSSLSFPSGLYCDDNRLIVADSGNNRVLIWNGLPTQDYEPADIVLGQDDFSTNTINFNGPSASSFYEPRYLDFDGTRLVVTDTRNNRVLLWNSLPTTNNKPADAVIGQKDFSSGKVNCGLSGTGTDIGCLSFPIQVKFFDEGRISIGDSENKRIQIIPYPR